MPSKSPSLVRGLSKGSRGTSASLLKIQGNSQNANQSNSKSSAFSNRLAFELSLLFRQMARFIELTIPQEVITPSRPRTYQVPIDKSLLASKNPGSELSIRFFRLALSEGHIKHTTFSLMNLYDSCGWKLLQPSKTKDQKVPEELSKGDIKKLIEYNLSLQKTTIAYTTSELPTLQKCYREWLIKERDRLREAAAWAQEQREMSVAFVGDFYRAHWNGLVGVVEGLAEVPLLIPNLVGKARGKDWTHASLGIAKIEYKSAWGKRNANVMEMAVGLGLTGPMMAISKSALVVSTMNKVGKTLNISPRAVKYIKALIIGSEIADTVITVDQVYKAIQIIYTKEIVVDGVTRPATKKEIEAAKELIFLHAMGRITSTTLAKTAHNTAGSMNVNSNRQSSNSSAKKSKKQIEKEFAKALNEEFNPEFIKGRKNTVIAEQLSTRHPNQESPNHRVLKNRIGSAKIPYEKVEVKDKQVSNLHNESNSLQGGKSRNKIKASKKDQQKLADVKTGKNSEIKPGIRNGGESGGEKMTGDAHKEINNKKSRPGKNAEKPVLDFDKDGLPIQLSTSHGANKYKIPPFKTQKEADMRADKTFQERKSKSKTSKRPHVLEVEVFENGKLIGSWYEVSEVKHNWSKGGDTEQKALSRINVDSKENVEIHFAGQYAPCSKCRAAMTHVTDKANDGIDANVVIFYTYSNWNKRWKKIVTTDEEFPKAPDGVE